MAQPAPLITIGIGPGGSVLYALTGGLEMGAEAPIWTDNSGPSTVWIDNSAGSTTWTDN